MFKKATLFIVLLVLSIAPLSLAQDYKKLLYEHDLKSEVSNDYIEIISKDGEFDQKDGWWGRRGNSKLIIKFADRLPQVGSIEFTMFGFVPTVHINDVEHVLCMLSSSWDNPLQLNGEEAWLSIRTGKQYLRQDESLAFELDAAPTGHSTRQNYFTPQDKVWEKGHAYKFRFVFDHNYLTVYIDDEEYAQFDFKNQGQRFKYLFLAGDYMHTSIAGIRFSNFKVYTHQPEYRTYFVDRTYSKNMVGLNAPSYGGNGLAVGDVNKDGLEDIYISSSRQDSCLRDVLLMQQADGTFVDETLDRWVDDTCSSYGVVFFDADNDGDLDLFNANDGKQNELYINNGQGYFSKEGRSRGLYDIDGRTRGAIALDVNRDGALDIFAVNEGDENEMYINNGSGGFKLERRGAEGQVENPAQIGTGAVTAADIDNDGDTDIFVAKQNKASELYLNDGGYFTEAAQARGVNVSDFSQSASFADFDADGDMDLVISSTSLDADNHPLYIFENNGAGYFTDRTLDFNLKMNGYSNRFVDIDNDGDLDLYRLNNEKTGSLLALNDGNGHFTKTGYDGSNIVGAGLRACSFTDFDHDGDLDFYITSQEFENSFLENQSLNTNNYLKIKLVGPAGDVGGIGSKIDVYKYGHLGDVNYLMQHHEVVTASGYLGGNNMLQHIGLGADSRCDVRVTFVNGVSADQANVVANQTITITAPEIFDILEYISGDGQSGKINTMLPQSFRVRLTDQFNTPQAGKTVNFVIKQGDGSFNGGASVQTNVDGYASVQYKLGSMEGEHIVEAQVPGAQNSPIRFSATAQIGVLTLTKVSGDNQAAPVNTILPQQIVVQTGYDDGSVAPNIDVTFTVISGGGSIQGAPSKILQSDATGRAAVPWQLGTVSGQQLLRVSAQDISVDFYATALAGAAAEFQNISGAGQPVNPGIAFPQPYICKVLDTYGNPVPNFSVEFSVTSGGGTVNDASQASISTDQQGLARAHWTPGPYLGPVNSLHATATDQGMPINGSPIVWSYPGVDVSASLSTVMATGPVLADGTSTSTIQVTLRNSQNQSVGAGLTVDILVSGSGNTLQIPNAKTDSNGRVTATLSSLVDETKTITAIVKGLNLELAAHPTVVFEPFDQTPDKIEIVSGNNQNVVANKSSQPLVIRILDTDSRPIPNYHVNFIRTVGEGTIDGQKSKLVTTGANGTASVVFQAGKVAGLVSQVEVHAADVQNSPATFTITTVADEARGLVIASGNNQHAPPNTQFAEPLVVRVQDIYGNAIKNHAVEFTVNIGACTLNGVSKKTVYSDAYGLASVQATTGQQQGQVIIEAKTAFTSVVFTLMVTEGLPDPDLAMSTLTATSPVLADGVSTSDVVVTIVDESGDPIEGIKIKLTAIGSGAILMQPDSLTNSDGKLHAQLASTSAGEKFILASVLPQNHYLQQRATVVFERGNPTIEIVSGHNQVGVAGQKCPEPLVVLLKNGDAVYTGQYVRFTVETGGGHFGGDDSVLVKTDDKGLASIDLFLGTTVGENIVRAAAPIAPDKGVTFKIKSVPGAGAKLVKHSGDEQMGRVNAALPQKLTVRVTDSYDNPVRGEAVTFSGVDGGSIASPQTALTDSSGYASATAICGSHIGNYIFKASLPNDVFVLFNATAEKSNNAPEVISYMPIETELPFSYNERLEFEITQAFDADNDPLSFYWHINDQLVGNQAKLLLFMSQLFGAQNTLICTITDGQDSTFVTWTLNLDTRVELSSFSAVDLKKSGILLQWTTASERDNLGFRILRSRVEDRDFVSITEQVIKPKSDRMYSYTDSDNLQPGDYFYVLESISTSGKATQHGPISVTIQAPDKFALLQNYPNPFNPTTTFAFDVPITANVRLEIYNHNGQLVRLFVDQEMTPGRYTLIWDARDNQGRKVPTGIYLYRLTANDFSETKKLTLLK